MRRVAYLWSPELMAVADALPANQGRSRMVHGLVRALGLVDFAAVQCAGARSPSAGDEGPGSESPRAAGPPAHGGSGPSPEEGRSNELDEHRAREPHLECSVRVVAPDPALCEAAELRRYHDADYVGASGRALLELTADYLLHGAEDEEDGGRPRKKRRKDKAAALGLEYVRVSAASAR